MVIIDDRFPLGLQQKLMCGHRLIFYYSYRVKSGSILSSKKNELWISILEKGYHKIRGGYDSYGSNPVNLEIKKQTGNKLLCLLFLAHRNSSNHKLDSGIF